MEDTVDATVNAPVAQQPSKGEKLYQNLINDGYNDKNLGSKDEFLKALADPNKAAKIYTGLRTDGYTEANLGSAQEFMTSFKKKALLPGGTNTFQPSGNGSNPSLPFQQDTNSFVNPTQPQQPYTPDFLTKEGKDEYLKNTKPVDSGFRGVQTVPSSTIKSDDKPDVDQVLSAHKNLDWVQRLFDKNAPSIQVPGEPDKSTHLMADDGNGYVFPTVVRINGKLQHLSEDQAYDYAKKTNSGIQMSKSQGTWFADNGYKTGSGVNNNIDVNGRPFNDKNFKLQQSPTTNGIPTFNVDESKNSDVEKQQQADAKQVKDNDKGSWKNIGSFAPDKILSGLGHDVASGVTGLGNFLSSDTKDHGLDAWLKPKLLQLGASLEANASKHDIAASNEALPNTTTGNLVSSGIGFVPDVIELAGAPELKLGKVADIIAKYGGKYAPKIAEMAGGKFANLMSTKGFLNGYNESKANGDTDTQAWGNGLVGAAKEWPKAMIFEAAGELGHGLTKSGIRVGEDAGLISSNKFVSGAEKRLVHSAAQGLAFSTVPIVTNAMQGKGTSLDEIKQNGLFGAVLGGVMGDKGAKGESTPADVAAQQIIKQRPQIDLDNFMNADMDAIKTAHHTQSTPADLQMMSAVEADNAFKASDPDQKQQAIVQSSIMGKLSGVKSIVNSILSDKKGFIDGIQQSDMPDEQKQALIQKAEDVTHELHPDEIAKRDLAATIQGIDEQLPQLTEMVNQATDPLSKATAETAVEKLTKEKSDAEKELKGIIGKQMDNVHTPLPEVKSEPIELTKPEDNAKPEAPEAELPLNPDEHGVATSKNSNPDAQEEGSKKESSQEEKGGEKENAKDGNEESLLKESGEAKVEPDNLTKGRTVDEIKEDFFIPNKEVKYKGEQGIVKPYLGENSGRFQIMDAKNPKEVLKSAYSREDSYSHGLDFEAERQYKEQNIPKIEQQNTPEKTTSSVSDKNEEDTNKPSKEVQTFAKSVNTDYRDNINMFTGEDKNGVVLELEGQKGDNKRVHIATIDVPDEKQKQGLGTQKMKDVTSKADEQGITLDLSVVKNATDTDRLLKWYKSLGFKETGKDTDELVRMERVPQSKPKIGDTIRKLADKIEQGKINKLGGFKTSTGFDTVWDASLSVVAETLRGGAKIADAIEVGLKHIRQTDWYKNLTDKKDFEDKYTEHLNNELSADKEPDQPKQSTGTTGVTKEDVKAKELKGSSGEVKKTILTTRAYEGEIQDDVKEYLEKKGLTRATFSQEERSKQATDFINKFGEDAAFQAVKTGDIDGGMALSVLLQLQIRNSKAMEEWPIGTDERDVLAKKQAEYIALDEKKGYLAGEYNGQRAFEYKNAELNYANVKKQVEDMTGRPLTKEKEAHIKKITDENERLKTELKKAEAKLIEETDKEFNDREKPEKPVKPKTEYAKKALDAVVKVRAKIRANSYSDATGMVALVDTGLGVIESGIRAGITVSKAIEKGIEHIKTELKKRGIDTWEKEDDFRKDVTDAFEAEGVKDEVAVSDEVKKQQANIKRLEKELAAAKENRLKDKGEKRDLSDEEKDLVDQIKREKLRIKLDDLHTRLADKSDNKFTMSEAKDIWDYMKGTYLDNGVSYKDAMSKASQDLGLSWTQISHAVTTPRNKPMSNNVWVKQGNVSRHTDAVRGWIEDQNTHPIWKAVKKVSGAFRGVAVAIHGHIFVATHAAPTLFDPVNGKHTVKAFFDSWKYSYGNEAAYQRDMQALTHSPNYDIARRAGLKNNPESISGEDYQNSQKYLGRIGLTGIRGFNAIKVLRQKLFDYEFDRLSPAERDDPNSAKRIAELMNLATGATTFKIHPLINEFTFAGGMALARFEKLVSSPARALNTVTKAMFKPDQVTPSEKVFAKIWVRRAGGEVATMTTALLANAAIQNYLNPKNPVNLTRPQDFDWFKFKFGDKMVDASSGMVSSASFIYKLGHRPFNSKRENGNLKASDAMGKDATHFAVGKLSPFWGTLIEQINQQDFNGNTLPYSNQKPSYYAHKLGIGEYALSKAPLPVAEGAKIFYESALQHGANKSILNDYIKAVSDGFFSFGTGLHMEEYNSENEHNK